MAEPKEQSVARAFVRAPRLLSVLADLLGVDMTYQDGRGFGLTVTVPADEYAYLERRLVYLEAVAVQLLRERCRIKEWFSAADLQALTLPGLPTARNAITRRARQQSWAYREVKCQGGIRYEYHYTSLPRQAFDALIERVIHPPFEETAGLPERQIPAIPAATYHAGQSVNTAPPWVLPLVRVLRSQEIANLDQVLKRLPDIIPRGMPCPTYEEAIAVLRDLGMVADN